VSVCSFVTPTGGGVSWRRRTRRRTKSRSHRRRRRSAGMTCSPDTDSWRSASSDERLVRSRTVTDRVRELTGYAHRSQPQEAELVRLAAEAVALDELVAGDARERVRIAAQDPANREEPNNGQPARSTLPSRFRPAVAGDGIWRSRSPRSAQPRRRHTRRST
jgi:hypothetical protein